jgi:hypothetical protein
MVHLRLLETFLLQGLNTFHPFPDAYAFVVPGKQ